MFPVRVYYRKGLKMGLGKFSYNLEIENNYKVSCLLYTQEEMCDPKLNGNNHPDRYKTYYHNTLSKNNSLLVTPQEKEEGSNLSPIQMIFYKNISVMFP